MRRPALDQALDAMRSAAWDGLRMAIADLAAAAEWAIIGAAVVSLVVIEVFA